MMRRNGHSLIELVTVMWILSVLIGVIGVFLQALTHTAESERKRQTSAAGVQRLLQTFRRDVRQSSRLGPEAKADRLRLVHERQTIDYSASPGAVTVIYQIGGMTQRQERFRLAKQESVQFEIPAPNEPAIVRVVVMSRPDERLGGVERNLTAEAMLGKNLRFAERP